MERVVEGTASMAGMGELASWRLLFAVDVRGKSHNLQQGKILAATLCVQFLRICFS